MSRVVNSETLIPLGLAVLIIGAVATWVSDVRGRVGFNTENIEALKKTSDATIKLVYEINSRLSRMEWSLENLKENRYGRNK